MQQKTKQVERNKSLYGLRNQNDMIDFDLKFC